MLDSLAVGDFVQLSEEQINSMFEVDYTMIHASVADALQTK